MKPRQRSLFLFFSFVFPLLLTNPTLASDITGARPATDQIKNPMVFAAFLGFGYLSSNTSSTQVFSPGAQLHYGFSEKWGIKTSLNTSFTLSGFRFIAADLFVGASYIFSGSLTRKTDKSKLDSQTIVEINSTQPSTFVINLGLIESLYAGSANSVVLSGFRGGMDYYLSSQTTETWKIGLSAAYQSNPTATLITFILNFGRSF